jgi:hypothetical protein
VHFLFTVAWIIGGFALSVLLAFGLSASAIVAHAVIARHRRSTP